MQYVACQFTGRKPPYLRRSHSRTVLQSCGKVKSCLAFKYSEVVTIFPTEGRGKKGRKKRTLYNDHQSLWASITPRNSSKRWLRQILAVVIHHHRCVWLARNRVCGVLSPTSLVTAGQSDDDRAGHSQRPGHVRRESR